MAYLFKSFIKLLIVNVILLNVSASEAQVLSPVKWSFSVNKITQTDSELILTATIDKGWHLYSQDIPEGGPVATTFTFEKGVGFLLVGKLIEPKAIEVFDNQFKMKVKYFSDKVEFRQKVKVMSAKPGVMKGVLEFMCCNDESCLPPKEEPFEFELPASK